MAGLTGQKKLEVLGFVVTGGQSLQIRDLTVDGHVLMGEKDSQGIPAWPIPHSIRSMVRRRRRLGGGTEIVPYTILSNLTLGTSSLPGQEAFQPTEETLCLAMSEQVSRVTTTDVPRDPASRLLALNIVLVLLAIAVLLIVVFRLLPGALQQLPFSS